MSMAVLEEKRKELQKTLDELYELVEEANGELKATEENLSQYPRKREDARRVWKEKHDELVNAQDEDVKEKISKKHELLAKKKKSGGVGFLCLVIYAALAILFLFVFKITDRLQSVRIPVAQIINQVLIDFTHLISVKLM